MITIKYEEKILRKHEEYYENVVLKSLEKKLREPSFSLQNLKVGDQEKKLTSIESKIIKFLNTQSVNDFKSGDILLNIELRKFLNFVESNYLKFATGNIDCLKILDSQIQVNFPLMSGLLKLTSDVSKPFKDYLNNAFGYKHFEIKSLFYYLKKYCLHLSNKESYDYSIKIKMIETMIELYPEYQKNIENELRIDLREKVDEFEKRFNSFNLLFLTTKNFTKFKGFKNQWSDYHLVMEGKVLVCPYCNRQYISPVITNSGKVRADLDHFLPQKRYPYFSMSLYNLVPSCKQCNQSLKRDKEFDFDSIHPFTEDLNEYFRFFTTPNFENNDVKIDIKIRKDKSKNIESFIEIFKLIPLYSYHNSHVQDLIKKRIIYSEEYLKELFHQTYVKDKFNTIEELSEFIVGFVADKNKINSDALMKLKRDISSQLGFFDYSNNNFNDIPKHLITELEKLV